MIHLPSDKVRFRMKEEYGLRSDHQICASTANGDIRSKLADDINANR